MTRSYRRIRPPLRIYDPDALLRPPRLGYGSVSFEHLSDREIIDEMKRRGYYTIPFDNVVRFESHLVVDPWQASYMDAKQKQDYLVSAANHQASALAHRLKVDGAFDLTVKHVEKDTDGSPVIPAEDHLVTGVYVVYPPGR